MLTCQQSCLQKKLREKCNCVDKVIDDDEDVRCNLLNRTHETCRQQIYYLFDNQVLGCYCPAACLDLDYQTKVSHSIWPSPAYMGMLYSRMKERREVSTLEAIGNTDNLVRVHVYFEDLQVHSIDEHPEYSEGQLWADIGGTMGLCLGASLCTGVEFVELLCNLITVLLRRCFRSRDGSSNANRVASTTTIQVISSTSTMVLDTPSYKSSSQW